MDKTELRLRVLELAAKAPIAHHAGPADGVVAVAERWLTWVEELNRLPPRPSVSDPMMAKPVVLAEAGQRRTLTVPKK
jgi:hypothetical protein